MRTGSPARPPISHGGRAGRLAPMSDAPHGFEEGDKVFPRDE